MFSVNRFDPNQQPHSVDHHQFNPLARLNQRLKQQPKQEQQQTIEQQQTLQEFHPTPCPEAKQIEERDEHEKIPISKKQRARVQLGFTGPNSIPLPSLDTPDNQKTKTSAKLKYLKRKKERKKSKKLLLRQSTPKKHTQNSNEIKQNDQEEDFTSNHTHSQKPITPSESTISNSQSRNIDNKIQDSPTTEQQIPKKRPKNLDSALEKINKKKIKTKHHSSNQSIEQDEKKNQNTLQEEEEQGANEDMMIVNQPGALPRFPAPTNTTIPDPQLLARLAMGLGYPESSTSSSHQLQDFIHFNSQSIFNLDQIPIRPSLSIPCSHSPAFPHSKTSPPFSLSDHSLNRLSQLGFKSILAVQIAVFSILMPSLSWNASTPASNFYPTRNPPRDLCVNAPTGSGKTLSYILPIIETLKSRLVCRIRALIVLPTRDLVLQVKNTFETFSTGTGLKAAILTGHHSFAREQALIGASQDALEGSVDVLIATPGRLLDHLAYTPGFSTDHLCFLVLDEADQLLKKKSSNWLNQILNPTKHKNNSSHHDHGHTLNSFRLFNKSFRDSFEDERYQDEFSNLGHEGEEDDDSKLIQHNNKKSRYTNQSSWSLAVETYNPCRLRPFRILLFSATLKRDPTQVDHLGLRNPIFIKVSSAAHSSSNLLTEEEGIRNNNEVVMKSFDDSLDHLNGFSLPSSLKQHIIVTRTDLKPLVFMKLIISKKIKKALCFCKSIEGAERLTSLCKLIFTNQKEENSSTQIPKIQSTIEDQDQSIQQDSINDLFKVECFSSDLSPIQRGKLLKSFQLGQINMLICSDMIARGIDIPQVQNVINYDAPIDMKKYVHRVGRTARANEIGFAFTLIESQEAKFFKNFLKINLGGPLVYKKLVTKLRFNWFDLKDLNDAYQIGLKKLAEKYGRFIDL